MLLLLLLLLNLLLLSYKLLLLTLLLLLLLPLMHHHECLGLYPCLLCLCHLLLLGRRLLDLSNKLVGCSQLCNLVTQQSDLLWRRLHRIGSLQPLLLLVQLLLLLL